jgi:hypothetical protein
MLCICQNLLADKALPCSVRPPRNYNKVWGGGGAVLVIILAISQTCGYFDADKVDLV